MSGRLRGEGFGGYVGSKLGPELHAKVVQLAHLRGMSVHRMIRTMLEEAVAGAEKDIDAFEELRKKYA